MQLKRAVRGTFLALVTAVTMGMARGTVYADPTVTLSKWLENIKFGGDFRLREEYFDRNTTGQTDRNRLRYRLRLNTAFKINEKWVINGTLASGTGEQVSSNQSFDNLSSQKQIWVDKIYVTWAPFEMLKLQGGKMLNPLWRPYASDAVWDTDFNPEGFSQGIDTLVGPIRLFANALQMVGDEDSGANGEANQQSDQWEFTEQVGFETRLPFESRLKAAWANHYWNNENQGTLSLVAVNDGNRRSATGVLLNNFNVNELTGELSTWVFRTPVSLQGIVINNRGARDDLQPKLNKGYQAGGIVGKAAEKNTFEVAYFNKYLEQDSTIADVSDSDFGDGGTNRKGHIYWIAWAPYDWMLVQLKHFDVDVITKSQTPSVSNALGEDIRRTQFDVTWKF
jgi:hypothetical protein